MGLRKKYELHGGVILILDAQVAAPRYHDVLRTEVPTVILLFQQGSITQEAATKAANRVMSSSATVTKKRVELCTRSAVLNWTGAIALADAFAEELHKILANRDKVVAASRARKAASREGSYYQPPAHLMARR